MNRYTCVNPGACDCGRLDTGQFCRHWEGGEHPDAVPADRPAPASQVLRDALSFMPDGYDVDWSLEAAAALAAFERLQEAAVNLLVRDFGDTSREREALRAALRAVQGDA